MGRKPVEDLLSSFRESRNQQEVGSSLNEELSIKIKLKSDAQSKPSKYQVFLNKYEELEDWVDDFSTQDLMYFFKVKALECGIKYTIVNMKRDLGIFKRLINEEYTPREICTMIEFLFSEEQTFLSKRSMQPTILVSTWCNTLYTYSQEWLNDEYTPHEKRLEKKKIKFKPVQVREWEDSEEVITNKSSVKIGAWE